MKHLKICSIGLLGMLLLVPAVLNAKNGDWQQWTESRFVYKINDDFDASFRYEQRLEEDASRFAVNIFEPIFTWHQSKNWDFNVTYRRFERYEPAASANNEATTAVTLKLPISKELDFSNRFRFQFVVPEGSGPDWYTLYRNKTELRAKLKVEDFEFQPFIWEELFVNIDEGLIDQNRAAVGVGFPITEELVADFAFMRLDRKTAAGWEWHPIGLVSLKVVF